MADEAGKPYSFGITPPRSLESFGVAGLLGEKSKVFYSSIFTTKHIGRVTDLLVAKLHDEGLDELRLRALVLFSAFEVFRSQAGPEEGTSRHRLNEPLVVECGLDEDRVAIGVSFTADEDKIPQVAGLVQRISEGKPEGEFEKLLAGIHAHADRTVLRNQAGIRRVEIVALLGISNKIDPAALTDKTEVHIIEIGAEQKADPPKVKAYIELGDLDYPELLKETLGVQEEAPPATGEVLMHGCKEVDDAVKIRAANLLEALAENRVKGTGEDGNDLRHVKGGAAGEGGSGFKVTAGGAIEATDGAVIVKGSAAAAAQADSGYKLRSLELPRAPDAGDSGTGVTPAQQSEEQGSDESNGEGGGSENGSSEEDGDSSNKLKDVIEKVKSAWPFRFGRGKAEAEKEEGEEAAEAAETEQTEKAAAPKKVKKAVEAPKETDEAEETEEDAPEATTEKAAKPKKKLEAPKAAEEAEEEDSEEADSAPPPTTQPIVISTADIEKEAQKLTKEIETGIEKTVTRAQGEANELKGEMGSTRAKRWVDGLMGELVAEKARLAEASKSLNASIRQKELEFRTKEQLLTEELRRRDDMIRQKTNALTRVKEQLATAASSAEKLKGSKGGAGDDVHYKQKYTLVQKMLNSAKDENKELVEKVEDLKNQLMSAQLNSSKRNQPSASDFAALQAKYERTLRQTDEVKKSNLQLVEKLNEANKKERSTGSQDDLKKRLEAQVKASSGYQRDAEKMKERVEEMQREHMRLQAELNKVNHELKSARVGSKTQQAAAPAAATAATAAKPATAAAAAKPAAPAGAAKPATAAAAAKPAAPAAAAKPATAAAPAKPATAPAAAAAPKPGTGGKSNPPKAA